MKGKGAITIVWLTSTLIFLSFYTCAGEAKAAEVQDPLISEWLTIVGEDPKPDLEWEKQWVGKTIDGSNVDGVKDLISEITYNVVKQLGGSFKIEAAKIDFRPSPGWIKATRANIENKPYLDDQMVLHNFVGGCPFPRPEMDPVKIAHNRDRGTWEGDDFIYRKVRFYVVDAKGHGRTVQCDYSRMRFAYRADVEPVPEFPNNTGGVYRSTQLAVMEPSDLRNLNMMVVKYKDSAKQDDVWIYVPTMRRVRRMSAGQRCDSMAGTDLAWEDADLYDGEVRVNEYKMIAKKDQLLPHVEYPYPEDMQLKGLWVHGVAYSKRPCYLIEANSKIPNFCYTKRIWYIDPISSRIYTATLYDAKGRLWKEHITGIARGKKDFTKPEGAVNNPNFINYVDWIARHGSPWLYDPPKPGEMSGPYTNSNFAPDLFTVEGIKKGVH